MSSALERKRAAKEKLASLANQRREAKIAEDARKEAKKKAKLERQSKQTDNGSALPKGNEKKETAEESPVPMEEISAAQEDSGIEVKTKSKKKVKKSSKAKASDIVIIEGKKKKAAVVELVPKEAPNKIDIDAYREKHNIVCTNAECLPPLQTFEEAESFLGMDFVNLLKDRGFVAPSPIQAQAWPLAFAGKDIVGIAQTGSGKTMAYLLPVLVRFREKGDPSTAVDPALPTALVLAPTRELIQQIATDVSKLAISIKRRFVPCFGGVWKGAQLKQLGKGCDILLSTPGRLKDFMAGDASKGHPPAVDVKHVSYLVLDEADAMLAMGFMPQVREIVEQCVSGIARQTLFFTATWPVKVKAAAHEFTNQAVQLRIGQGVGSDKLTANKNVRQIIQMVEHWAKMSRLINVLTSELKPGDTCLVFCSTKGRTEYVVDSINEAGLVDWCDGIHSGKEQWVRDATLEHFRQHTKNGDRRAVLVATDVAARGLDIPGVALVVVYDLNGWNGELNIDSYVHRIGRTGRAGMMGRAFTFVESKDRGLPDLVKLLQDAGQRIPAPLQDVEASEKNPLRKKRKRKKDPEQDDGDSDDGHEGLQGEDSENELQKGGKRQGKKGDGKGKGKNSKDRFKDADSNKKFRKDKGPKGKGKVNDSNGVMKKRKDKY